MYCDYTKYAYYYFLSLGNIYKKNRIDVRTSNHDRLCLKLVNRNIPLLQM